MQIITKIWNLIDWSVVQLGLPRGSRETQTLSYKSYKIIRICYKARNWKPQENTSVNIP